MASNTGKTSNDFKSIVIEFNDDYAKARDLYNKAGLDAALKESALQAMANALQLQTVAVQNYANWKHILREDAKINKK